MVRLVRLVGLEEAVQVLMVRPPRQRQEALQLALWALVMLAAQEMLVAFIAVLEAVVEPVQWAEMVLLLLMVRGALVVLEKPLRLLALLLRMPEAAEAALM